MACDKVKQATAKLYKTYATVNMTTAKIDMICANLHKP